MQRARSGSGRTLPPVLPVVHPLRDAVVRGGPVDGERGLDAVSQAEQLVGHGAAPVEVLDLDAGALRGCARRGRAASPSAAAPRSSTSCGGRPSSPARSAPDRPARSPAARAGNRQRARRERLGLGRRGAAGPPAPEEPLEQRRRGEAVGAVDAGAGDLARRAQVPERRARRRRPPPRRRRSSAPRGRRARARPSGRSRTRGSAASTPGKRSRIHAAGLCEMSRSTYGSSRSSIRW